MNSWHVKLWSPAGHYEKVFHRWESYYCDKGQIHGWTASILSTPRTYTHSLSALMNQLLHCQHVYKTMKTHTDTRTCVLYVMIKQKHNHLSNPGLLIQNFCITLPNTSILFIHMTVTTSMFNKRWVFTNKPQTIRKPPEMIKYNRLAPVQQSFSLSNVSTAAIKMWNYSCSVLSSH